VPGQVTVARVTASSPPTLTFCFSGNSVKLTRPADHTGWCLEGQTNSLSVGLSNHWFTVAESMTTHAVSLPIDSAQETVFYRQVYPQAGWASTVERAGGTGVHTSSRLPMCFGYSVTNSTYPLTTTQTNGAGVSSGGSKPATGGHFKTGQSEAEIHNRFLVWFKRCLTVS
jgi:hypothetical protein